MEIETLYQIYLKHRNIVIDSRKVESGCLFFALRGPNFDANAFALSALEAGAAYAIVDDPEVCSDIRCLYVPNVLRALQDLALYHRRQWSIPVVGITGTNGKTTTKELVAAVLETTYPVHYTKGNLNNHIGVPLTILSAPPESEIAIIEMGANKPGDIAELCAIAEPTHGLITNIGKAHLEGLVNLAGVKKTKSELYQFLAEHNGLGFIHRNEKYLSSLSRCIKRRIFYGAKDAENINDPELIKTNPFLSIRVLKRDQQPIDIHTKLAGSFNFPNILTAIAVGNYFKVSVEHIQKALAQYTPRMNRSQSRQWKGAEIFLDAYNANPTSMAAALTHFRAQKAKRKVVIIGDMFELGADAEKEHKKIYRQATKTDADLLITIGTEFGKVKQRKLDMHFDNTDALKLWFNSQNWEGATILLKGSRGMKLEIILE